MDKALSEGLEAISGLDAALGLRHLRGRLDSYVRLLEKFAETRDADIAAMRGQLAAGDYGAVAALAHNIKGVAGFLGAIEIQGLAAEVSAAAHGGSDRSAELDRLGTALMEAQSEVRDGVLALIGQLSRTKG